MARKVRGKEVLPAEEEPVVEELATARKGGAPQKSLANESEQTPVSEEQKREMVTSTMFASHAVSSYCTETRKLVEAA